MSNKSAYLSVVILLVSSLVVGCSLSGDIKPPNGAEIPLVDSSQSQPTNPILLTPLPQPTVTPSNVSKIEVIPREVTISGNVINASGGPLKEKVVVTLQVFDNMMPVFNTDTPIDQSDGNFGFKDVEVQDGRTFLVSTKYLGQPYSAEVIHSSDLKAKGDVQIQILVYDLTTDPSNLIAGRVHIFFDFVVPGKIQVTEFLIISNLSQLIFGSPQIDQPSLIFTLPSGTTDLEIQSGSENNFILTEEGFGFLAPIYPGQQPQEILFAYQMPYERKLDLTLSFPVAVDSGVLALQSTGANLRSEQLSDTGMREVQGTQMQFFELNNLPAGKPLYLSLSGRVGGSPTSDRLLGIIIGGTTLILVLIFTWLWLRRRRDPGTPESNERSTTPPPDDREALIDAIITLDDMFRSGELSEEVYHQRRSEIKKNLKSQ